MQQGIQGTSQDLDSDFVCPVCFELIREAHIVSCGHTFCRVCLEKAVQLTKRCPKCNFTVFDMNNIFPNHLVNQQVNKYREQREMIETSKEPKSKEVFQTLSSIVRDNLNKFDENDLSDIIEFLNVKRSSLITNNDYTSNSLLTTFLSQLEEKKVKDLSTLQSELAMVRKDLKSVRTELENNPEVKLEKDESEMKDLDAVDGNVPSTSTGITQAADAEEGDCN